MPSEVVVDWMGDIDISAVALQQERLDHTIDSGLADPLILDLTGVTFIDAFGIGLIVHARTVCQRAKVDLRLRGVGPQLRQVLAVTGLVAVLAIDYAQPMADVDPATLPASTLLPARADVHFDRIAVLAAKLLGAPTATVTLVDQSGQYFPGAVGVRDPFQEQRSTPLSHSLCQHVVSGSAELIVCDLGTDPLFAHSPARTALGIEAYVGTPVTHTDGRVVGSLCVMDETPRNWNQAQLADLRLLAEIASNDLQARAAAQLYRAASNMATRNLLPASLHLADALARSNGSVAADISAALGHADAALTALSRTA